MPTSRYAFQARQYQAIWDEGTLLMTRYEEEDAINLWHMAGGFGFPAKVYYAQHETRVYRTNAFTSTEYLGGHYGYYVQLPPVG